MEALTLRQATAADVSELARLRWDFFVEHADVPQETFSHFQELFTQFWSRRVEAGNWTVWVAQRKQRLVGNIWVERIAKVPRPDRPHAEYGYVTNVYVEPESR